MQAGQHAVHCRGQALQRFELDTCLLHWLQCHSDLLTTAVFLARQLPVRLPPTTSAFPLSELVVPDADGYWCHSRFGERVSERGCVIRIGKSIPCDHQFLSSSFEHLS